MEYRHRKKKHYCFGGELFGERLYGVFEVIGGWGKRHNPLFDIRGLPGDVTNLVYEEYKNGKPDYHHPSWLTTEELRMSLDEARHRFESTSPVGDDDWLRPYERIYEYMLDYEKVGETCRIVFWFDN